ncbi:unnamed protein product [Trichobilharzia regenti]|nr:unnamed protein product [Trichobilharzia regenti]
MLLRSVYGSLGADSLKRTSQQYASQLQSQQMGNIYNRSDFDYQQHNKTVQSSFTNENMATSGFGTTDSSFVRNQDGKMTVKQFQQPGLEKRKQCDTNSNDNNNDNKNSTGVRLSSILESLGFRDPDGRQNEKLTSKIKLDYSKSFVHLFKV